MKLIIVGFSQAGQMGNYLASAARQLGLDYQIINAGSAEATSKIGQSFYWRLCGKRPARLDMFGAQVLDRCAATRGDVILTTGFAPLDRSHVEGLRGLGAKVVNYSTDDPWNPTRRAKWFLSALPSYDAIFTPRRANLDDFNRCGVRAVHYLPFAYDPEVHRPWPESEPAGAPSDGLFVGGCDADRLPLVRALIELGAKDGSLRRLLGPAFKNACALAWYRGPRHDSVRVRCDADLSVSGPARKSRWSCDAQL